VKSVSAAINTLEEIKKGKNPEKRIARHMTLLTLYERAAKPRCRSGVATPSFKTWYLRIKTRGLVVLKA
jgi:hypothetical protein